MRLIIFFAAKDGEALYREQKQDWELTVAQIMNSLFPNSGLKLKKVGKTTRWKKTSKGKKGPENGKYVGKCKSFKKKKAHCT